MKSKLHFALPLTATIALLLTPLAVAVPTLDTTWQNAGTSSWFNEGNWNAGVPTSASNATVSNAGTSQLDSGGTGNANILTIGAGSSVQVISGSTLALTSSAQIGQGTLQVGAAFTSGGNLTGAVNFTSAQGVLSFQTSTTYNQNVTGAGQIQINTGFVTLGGVNTQTGGLSLDGSATLQVSSDAALGAKTGAITVGNATIKYLAGFNSARRIGVANFLQIDTNAFSSTLSGVISGKGSLDKIGAGTLTLTGHNTYAGDTSVDGGTLVVASDANLGAPTGRLFISNSNILKFAGNFVSSRNGAFQDGVIDTNGFNAHLKGDFSSEGGSLTKIGRGTLTLSGEETYGTTFVQGGTLILNGTTSFDVVVGNEEKLTTRARQAAAAVLPPIFGGVGVVGGNLLNAGVVNPGTNGAGTLNVTGNYTQFPNGTLHIELGGYNPGQFDLLKIGGTATLAGNVRFSSLNGFIPSNGARFIFLTAGGGVAGKFAAGSFDLPLYQGLVQYDPNDVAVLFARRRLATIFNQPGVPPAQQPRLTPNQKAVAKAIDHDPGDPRLDLLFARLNDFGLAGLPHALDLIAPEELSVIYEIGIGTANVQAFNLDRHFGELRAGRTGFSADRLSIASYDPKTYVDPKASPKDAFAPTPENRWSTFISGSGEFLNIGSDYNARGYDITTGGMTLGADYRITPTLAVGALFGYAGTRSDLADGGHVNVNSGKFGLYVSSFTQACYLNAAVIGGYNSYDIKRRGFLGDTYGNTEGGEISTLVTTGHDFHAGPVTFGPLAELQYTWVGYGRFTERGTIANLDVLGNESDSLRSRVGAHVSTTFGKPAFRFKPELRVVWQHEYLDQTRPTDSQFASGAGQVFRVLGPQIGRDSIIVNASITLLHGDRWSTYLAYDGQLARERYTSHAISGGIQIDF